MSKPSLTDARWRAERIGPTIIAVPHRGQVHAASVSVVEVAVGMASADGVTGGGLASRVRARATRVMRQVCMANH